MTTTTSRPAASSTVADLARRARQAALRLASLSDDQRRRALLAAADLIERRSADILAANARDCAAARPELDAGRISPSLFKRLQTSPRGVAEMAAHVRGVADLPDPLGRELAVTALDDDLTLYKISCPLGVFAVIFEARPEVLPQIASLALRSGNAVLLKGGSEAEHTNTVLADLWRQALAAFPQIPPDAVTLLHTREDVTQLLALDDLIDLVVPRGSQPFVRYIMEHSRIPVLGHGEGICHVYLDRAADPAKALAVALDSKIQYPAACNAAETLLIHADAAAALLPPLVERFAAAGVQLRGCERTRALVAASDDARLKNTARGLVSGSEAADMKSEAAGMKSEAAGMKSEAAGVKSEAAGMKSEAAGMKSEAAGMKSEAAGVTILPATDEDWATEYSDLILSIRVVSSLDEAIDHINRWGSKHTDSIVTEDPLAAAAFMDRVDAAGVYHNVSTRFADGFRYGLGAELGISNAKLHARGPVGLEGLTTYKYKLVGNGHTVASYTSGERHFKHRRLR